MIFRILLLVCFVNVAFLSTAQQAQLDEALQAAKNCNPELANRKFNDALASMGITRNDVSKSQKLQKILNDINGYKKKCEQVEKNREEQEKNQNIYISLMNKARQDLKIEDYSSASENVRSALKLMRNDNDAINLLDDINYQWSRTYILAGEKDVADGRLNDAVSKYETAYSIHRDENIKSIINDLKNKIRKQEQNRSQYNELVKQAEKEFKLENFDQCLAKLESADDYISLQNAEINLKRKANLGKNLKSGNMLFTSQKYAEAISAYESALKYATQSDEQTLVKGKIKAANYEMKVKSARSYYNDKNYERTIEILKEVRETNELKSEDASLLQKALTAYDDQSFQKAKDIGTTDSYEKYLSKFPKGGHVSEANEFLRVRYEKDGDDYLKGHWYDNAVANYEKAKKYSNDDDALDRKIRKVHRWKNDLTSGLTVDFALPLGFNSTAVETEDYYRYIYHLASAPPVDASGIGHQKISRISPITPLNASANYALKLKIPSVKPLNINFGIKYSMNQASNLSKVTPISYEIFEGVHTPTSQAITSVDTLSFYFNNAYKFSQIQFKIGIQPLSFLEVYMPINKMTLRYQNDYDCLDCANDNIEVGNKISIGLGLKLQYKFTNGLFLSGFAENWNAAFNSISTTNELIDPTKKAKSGLFSFSPFSSSKGLSIGFPVTDYFDMYFSYINNSIRGDYRATPTSMTSLRSFNQHLFSINFRYNIF